ncbi:MAG: transcription/translation regulatory transformer protein RfaH [Halomonadaceae bacterium]|nr:MAG: transcription/translation regulatory transformer protein RfaH [Halomonadaceae bacterium]
MAWYAVQYKPAQGERALENLEQQGVECFFPQIAVEHIRQNKRQWRTEALFKGYLFIALEDDNPLWQKLRSTRGVSRVVSFANRPAAIESEVIEQIRQGLEQISNEGGLRAGVALEIQDGPFRGLRGVFDRYDGEERALILIEFLHKLHTVSMPLKDLKSL